MFPSKLNLHSCAHASLSPSSRTASTTSIRKLLRAGSRRFWKPHKFSLRQPKSSWSSCCWERFIPFSAVGWSSASLDLEQKTFSLSWWVKPWSTARRLKFSELIISITWWIWKTRRKFLVRQNDCKSLTLTNNCLWFRYRHRCARSFILGWSVKKLSCRHKHFENFNFIFRRFRHIQLWYCCSTLWARRQQRLSGKTSRWNQRSNSRRRTFHLRYHQQLTVFGSSLAW